MAIRTTLGIFCYFVAGIIISACSQSATVNKITPEGQMIRTRIGLPKGYKRIEPDTGSFGYFLQHLPLKPHLSPVRYYNGKQKQNIVHIAVLDISTGKRNLQQCADAIIRLRAEYFWHQNRPEEICFNFTNGMKVPFNKWCNGYRVHVDGNQSTWKKTSAPSHTYSTLQNYLTTIFIYAGTLSLSKELKDISTSEIRPGDVWIQGGSPGHAVIVVDMARHTQTGEPIFLLAQSYMPAQDIHVLINPTNNKISPWYQLPENNLLVTPEWTFHTDDLKRFP